jgi:zinc-ribbon domain
MFCRECGFQLSDGQKFCGQCGKPTRGPDSASVATPPSASQVSRLNWQKVLSSLKKSVFNPEGFAESAVQVVALYLSLRLVSIYGWPLFASPGNALSFIVPGYCGALAGQEGTFQMFLCSSKVAAETYSGPLILAVLLFLLRKPIMRGLSWLARKLKPEFRFVVLPLACTVLFSLTWAAIHTGGTDELVGIVSQHTFPALVGAVMFLSIKCGSFLQGLLAPLLSMRDVIPFAIRVVLVFAIPFVLSFLLNHQLSVTDPATKEQEIVLLSMTLGYLALAPNPTKHARYANVARAR